MGHPADTNRYKFTGKERDGESGLDNFGARYYGGGLGRFTGPDVPFADQDPKDPQSWNLYGYVRNNPLRYTDPTGNACVSNGNGGWLDDDQGGETCAEVEEKNKKAKASAIVNGCEGEGAADCLAFMVSDRTTLANTTEVVRNGVEGAMTAEAIWNLPSLFRGGVSWLKALRTAKTEWKFGTFKGAQRWASQMAKRGWTEKQITEAIESGQQFPAVNNVNPANTATRYVHPSTGRSVVVDDVTKEVLHIGGDGFKY